MNISTKDAMGKMFFTMMSAFAELEANLLSERTKRLSSSKKEGEKAGALLPDHKREKLNFYMMNKTNRRRNSR